MQSVLVGNPAIFESWLTGPKVTRNRKEYEHANQKTISGKYKSHFLLKMLGYSSSKKHRIRLMRRAINHTKALCKMVDESKTWQIKYSLITGLIKIKIVKIFRTQFKSKFKFYTAPRKKGGTEGSTQCALLKATSHSIIFRTTQWYTN